MKQYEAQQRAMAAASGDKTLNSVLTLEKMKEQAQQVRPRCARGHPTMRTLTLHPLALFAPSPSLSCPLVRVQPYILLSGRNAVGEAAIAAAAGSAVNNEPGPGTKGRNRLKRKVGT